MNQREIKFEVAIKNKENGNIWKPVLILDELLDRNGCLYTPQLHEILYKREYTGLKDAKGREVYEGDILENKYPDKMEATGFGFVRVQVAFNDFSFGWIGENTGKHHPFDYSDIGYWEVIGNIYEHPHMLENGIISPSKTPEA